jgi:aminoglycoside 6'-N-acetyltransferase
MILYEHGDITVKSLKTEDASHLVKWLSDPVVLEFYGGRDRPYDYEKVMQHFYRDGEVTSCIVEFRHQAIGYIQFYVIGDEERTEYGYQDDEALIYGMDQFIGEAGCWNQGIGTALVRSMRDYVIKHQQASKIVMDPQAWNSRALRVYEKCGFKKKRLLPKHEWHEGEYRDCWLIEYKREAEDDRLAT